MFFAILAATAATPQSPKDAQITAYSNDVGVEGYNFQFQTSDGISRNEEGVLKNVGTDNEALEVKGKYTYKAPDGKDVTVEFVANENGYQPRVSARRK